MPTSRHREYADDFERDPRVRGPLSDAARRYAVALSAFDAASAEVDDARTTLLAAVERER